MDNNDLKEFEVIAKNKLTHEQKEAVICNEKNTLVCARAGTGKTFTLAAKVWHLINNCKIDPDEILVLSFNKKAATEIGRRINQYCGNDKFKNARTFDSLAYQTLEAPGTPLIQTRDKENVYNSIFKDISEAEGKGFFFNFKKWWYLQSECNSEGIENNKGIVTFNGEDVKSMGEKLIADFLFEHNIEYTYESEWLWDGKPYHPDFQIKTNNGTIIWEHWAINPTVKPNINQNQIINESEYYESIQKKRAFWHKNSNVRLLETSIADLQINKGEIDREHFSKVMKVKLTNLGLTLRKLSDKELAQRIYKKNKKQIIDLFENYMSLAQADCFSPQEMTEKIEQYTAADNKTIFFLKFANDFYTAYLNLIKNKNSKWTDFHDIKMRAINTIEEKRGDLNIKFGYSGRKSNLNKLKWILIDEYQDFSGSFYRIINTIRRHNNDVKIFCVGDDWQSINGYAGSNIKYYKNFQDYFGEYKSLSLLTNRRSPSDIVNISNDLMRDTGGVESNYLKEGGIIDMCYLFNNNDKQDKKTTADYMMAMCLSIFALYGKDRTITFLSRTNEISGMSHEDFSRRIEMFLSNEHRILFKKCIFSTVNSYKGEEADVVVLLGADKWLFPLINPKYKYFEIFRSKDEITEEEKRLFYVAITRPKHRLVLVASNRETVSPFYTGSVFQPEL